MACCQRVYATVQGRTMPVQAKHSASFQGAPYRFTIQPNRTGFASAPASLKLACHGHMYVGRLRQMIAPRLGVEPEHLRVIANGDPSFPASCCRSGGLGHHAKSIGRRFET